MWIKCTQVNCHGVIINCINGKRKLVKSKNYAPPQCYACLILTGACNKEWIFQSNRHTEQVSNFSHSEIVIMYNISLEAAVSVPVRPMARITIDV